MRRVGLLFLLLASAATAQPARVPDSNGRSPAAPHWRASVSGGLSGALTGVAMFGLERTVSGPFSVGARGVAYSGSGFVDDGGSTVGGGAEVVASAATRGRSLDLRGFVGAGGSVVRATANSFPLDPPGGPPPPATPPPIRRPFRPHLVGGVGLDIYPLAAVGVGVEVRGVVGVSGGLLSTVGAGLRVRFGR